MNNIFTNYIDNFKNLVGQAVTEKTNEIIGSGMVSLGTWIEEISAIIIMLGVLLWICKNTKVFRIGCISYVIGLLIELIGSVMIK